MPKIKNKCTDPAILKNRITVTDDELCILLGVSKNTARKYAEDRDAVVFCGNRRLTYVNKLFD